MIVAYLPRNQTGVLIVIMMDGNIMKRYRFEIQKCIYVEVDAENAERYPEVK